MVHMMKQLLLYKMLSACLLFGTLICCSGEVNIETENSISIEELTKLKESPVLVKMVQNGTIPELEKRLPDDPMIIEPLNMPGNHGGIWHFDAISKRDVNLVYHISNPSFLRWDKDGVNVVEHLCRKYEVSDEGKVWTVYLRRGVKWSDGHPFTTEAVRFWYEDDALNRDINPIPKEELLIGEKFGKIEIIDVYTFRVVFPKANWGFYQRLTSIVLFYAPGHYMKQFHIKYADPAELEEKMEQSGVKKWSELYKKMDRWALGFLNPERPSLRPWTLQENSNSPNTFEFARNPFYWVVDTAGKQLPYIDKIQVTVTSNDQVLAMNTIAGKFDFQWRRLNFKEYPLLKENAKKHNYELLTWPQDRGSDIALYCNYNCRHPLMGPLLRDKRFRIALSQAINRNELNLLFYKNIGVPRQATAAETTPFYEKENAEKYITYSIKMANKLLDELGLTKRDSEGFRLDKDGNEIYLLVECVASGNTVDILQIVCEYWRKAGIKADARIIEGSLLTQRTKSAEVMIQARPIGSFNPPTPHSSSMYFAPLFGLWKNTSGKQGLKPETEFFELIRLGDKLKQSSIEEGIEVLKNIYRLYAENIWVIGLVGEVPALLAKNDYFMNVPDKSLYSYARGRRLGLTLPEQYWIDLEKKNKVK